MQFGFIPERETIDAVYILRRMQEHHAKGKKLSMCFVDIEYQLLIECQGKCWNGQ